MVELRIRNSIGKPCPPFGIVKMHLRLFVALRSLAHTYGHKKRSIFAIPQSGCDVFLIEFGCSFTEVVTPHANDWHNLLYKARGLLRASHSRNPDKNSQIAPLTSFAWLFCSFLLASPERPGTRAQAPGACLSATGFI